MRNPARAHSRIPTGDQLHGPRRKEVAGRHQVTSNSWTRARTRMERMGRSDGDTPGATTRTRDEEARSTESRAANFKADHPGCINKKAETKQWNIRF
eukprot:14451460-Heterocapsa_arctica.AAC.1